MTIDMPSPGQLPQLRALWQTAFGDSGEFLDSFFTIAFSPRRCRCVTVDGDIAAALYWFDVSCEGQKMAYLYAVATAPAYREQGFCRRLMADTHRHLGASGYHAALLVPEGEALSRMYRGLGYQDGPQIREFVCAADTEPAPIHQIDKLEYARLRRGYLPQCSVVQEGESLAFLSAQARFYAGPGYIAAIHQEADAIMGLELLGDPSAAPGILLSLGAGYGTFRTPGRSRAFAMFLPLTSEAVRPEYFAFAFD